jgi:hypothetical protein
LKVLKKLGANEREFVQLKNLRWTEAQRADAKNYQPGLVVQFHQNAAGFKKGEKVTVTGIESNQLVVQHENGKKDFMKLGEGSAFFNVYESGQLALAPGDRLRITQNGMSKDGHRLNNGELRTVKKFTKDGNLVLENGWVVDKKFGNLAHGYCVTSHASQGKTVQRLFIAESEASLPAASREQFYVSASRGVEAIKIYTDNKDALMAAVAVSGARPAATDLAKGTLPEVLKEKSRRVSRDAVQVSRQHQRQRPLVPVPKAVLQSLEQEDISIERKRNLQQGMNL